MTNKPFISNYKSNDHCRLSSLSNDANSWSAWKVDWSLFYITEAEFFCANFALKSVLNTHAFSHSKKYNWNSESESEIALRYWAANTVPL